MLLVNEITWAMYVKIRGDAAIGNEKHPEMIKIVIPRHHPPAYLM